jgi:hypothetical protein
MASLIASLNLQNANVVPNANAGVDQNVGATAIVTLNSSASSDSDGSIVSYAWTQSSGTSVSLSSSSAVSPTFDASIANDNGESLVFSLIVTDNEGASSIADTVSIAVAELPNVAPTANAGIDQSVTATATVTLTGTGSSDSDGSLASYAWTQSSGTSVSLSSSSVVSPTFDVSIANDNGESLVFSLIVTDNEGASSVADIVSIAVAELQNQAPIASAGSLNTTEDVAASGVLQAQDPDDDSLTFSIVTSPTKGSLQIDNNQTGAYTYIPDSNQSGSDQFSFAVSDGIISSNTATTFVQIEAVNDQPSAFDASFDINVETTITGDLTASDIEGDSLAFSVINSPSQGQVQITNAMIGTFSYTSSANAAGQDTFTFHVNDGNHDSNIATVTFNITSLPTTPGNFTATGGDGEIALSWDTVDGASSYTVYLASDASVNSTNYLSLNGNQMISSILSPTFVVSGLNNYETYYFSVTASNFTGESGGSGTVSGTPMREDYLYINNIRREAGLNSYKRNAQLETAALNHSQYQVTNDVLGHGEISSDSHFTGTTASDRANFEEYDGYFSVGEVIAYDDNEQKSLDSLMSAIYHRFGLLRNDADEIGFGFFKDSIGELNQAFVGNNGNSKLAELCSGESFTGSGSIYTLCDPVLKIEASVYESARDYLTGRNPDLVIWPVDNAQNVLPVFYEESPDPLPDYSASGYPISAEFNTFTAMEVGLESFKLFNNVSGEEITNTRLLTNSDDPNGLFSAHQFALFPLDRLDYNTTYRVEFSYFQNGALIDKSWTFTTLDLGTVVYKINAVGDELGVNSGDTFHIYLPPTQLSPFMGGYRFSHSNNSQLTSEFVDSNTLKVTFTGAIGDHAGFNLNNGGTFEIKIK